MGSRNHDAPSGPSTPHRDAHEHRVWRALDEIPDPHIPASLVEMGMIHDVTITDDTATIELTYPCLGCPAYEFIQADIADHARTVDGIASVEIDIVWDPPWSKQRLSPETREKIRAAGIDL